MKFDPKTEDQLREQSMIPADTKCDFEVVEANHKTSKQGNEMIVVKLRVFNGEKIATIYDYLMASMGFKLLHFCEATNNTAEYSSGNLNAQSCVGKTGRCVVGVDKASGNYAAKNVVADYIGHRETKNVTVSLSSPVSHVSQVKTSEIADDDVPF